MKNWLVLPALLLITSSCFAQDILQNVYSQVKGLNIPATTTAQNLFELKNGQRTSASLSSKFVFALKAPLAGYDYELNYKVAEWYTCTEFRGEAIITAKQVFMEGKPFLIIEKDILNTDGIENDFLLAEYNQKGVLELSFGIGGNQCDMQFTSKNTIDLI